MTITGVGAWSQAHKESTAYEHPGATRSSPTPHWHLSEHEAVGFDPEHDLADRFVGRCGDEEVLGDGVDVAKPLLEGRREHRGPPAAVYMRSTALADAVAWVGGETQRGALLGGDERARPPGARAPWSPRGECTCSGRRPWLRRRRVAWSYGTPGWWRGRMASWYRRGRRRRRSPPGRCRAHHAAIPMENRPTSGKRKSAPSETGSGNGTGKVLWVGTKTSTTSMSWLPVARRPTVSQVSMICQSPASRNVVTISGPSGVIDISSPLNTMLAERPGALWQLRRTTICR